MTSYPVHGNHLCSVSYRPINNHWYPFKPNWYKIVGKYDGLCYALYCCYLNKWISATIAYPCGLTSRKPNSFRGLDSISTSDTCAPAAISSPGYGGQPLRACALNNGMYQHSQQRVSVHPTIWTLESSYFTGMNINTSHTLKYNAIANLGDNQRRFNRKYQYNTQGSMATNLQSISLIVSITYHKCTTGFGLRGICHTGTVPWHNNRNTPIRTIEW